MTKKTMKEIKSKVILLSGIEVNGEILSDKNSRFVGIKLEIQRSKKLGQKI